MRILIILLAVMCLLPVNTSMAQVVRQGNTFVQTTAKKSSQPATKTKYNWQDSQGKQYPIYISQNGRCFVKRVSSKGKEYKQYLGEEISKEIAKEMRIPYTPKKK